MLCSRQRENGHVGLAPREREERQVTQSGGLSRSLFGPSKALLLLSHCPEGRDPSHPTTAFRGFRQEGPGRTLGVPGRGSLIRCLGLA